MLKSRTLANLSPWPPARIQALRRALRGAFDQLAVDPTSGLVFGLLFALKQLAGQIGLAPALGKSRCAKLALFLVLARAAAQGSRLSAAGWTPSTRTISTRPWPDCAAANHPSNKRSGAST